VPADTVSPSKNNYSPPRTLTPPLLVIPDAHPQHIWQPSCIVQELLSGAAVSSTHSQDPVLPQGVQPPTTQLEGERSSSIDERDEVERGLELEGQGEDELTEHALAAAVSEAEVLEPCTLNEAKGCPSWPLWEKVIEEPETLHTASTWVLEDAPPAANTVGLKWIFKAKKDASSNIICYRL